MSTDVFAPLREAATALEADGFSGILRATRGDEVIHESCHGYANRADRIPIHSGTRFGTASLSKMFTAVGVLDAAGRGEVGVHDRVIDVLPAEKRPSTLRDDVTVHHLLSHSSGIGDYLEEDEDLPDYDEEGMEKIWAAIPNYTVRDYAALLPFFGDKPPNFPPGHGYHYSNAGFVLLGMILAEVSGMPFADAMATRVFEPAGMAGAGYPALDEVYPNVATGYLAPAVPGGPWRTNIYAVHPVGGGDGGAVVSASDIERFLRAVSRGGVWTGVTPSLMLTPYAHAEDRWSVGYGVNLRDDGAFGKDGGDPGVATVCRYVPAVDTTAVLLANVGWDDVSGIGGLWELLAAAAFGE